MELIFIEEETFENKNFTLKPLAKGEYEECTFRNCDLSGAIFNHTNIEKVDFRTSHNYSINPEINRIKKAKFSLNEVSGLLHKYDIEIE